MEKVESEGDINGGTSHLDWMVWPFSSISLWEEVSDPDATSGTCFFFYLGILPKWGFEPGAEITFSSMLTDRAGNDSNELDEPFTFP